MVLGDNLQHWPSSFQPCTTRLVMAVGLLNNHSENIGARGKIHER